MDLFELKGQTYLLIVDYYSRWVEVKHLSTLTSAAVIRQAKSVIAIHGIPDVVVSDNGPQFACAEFQAFAAEYGFSHVTSSPRYPQSNGEAERAVQTVKKIFKKAKDPYLALLSYRAAPLQNGYSPSELLMGRRLNTRVPTLPTALRPAAPDHGLVRGKEAASKEKQRETYNRRYAARESAPLQPGDAVHVRDLDRQGLIIQRHTSPRSYVVRTDQGVVRRNARHLMRSGGEQSPPQSPPQSKTQFPKPTVPTTSPVIPADTLISPGRLI